jgi:hypothetical protein
MSAISYQLKMKHMLNKTAKLHECRNYCVLAVKVPSADLGVLQSGQVA